MESIKLIRHNELNEELLQLICHLKSSAWPSYNLQSQQKWIKENIFPDDYHFLLFNGTNLAAYLNLFSINLWINDKFTLATGVGSVCSSEKGFGFGRKLMLAANKYIIKQNTCGLLFCNNNLTPFYKKYNWFQVDNYHTTLKMPIDFNAKIMLYNIDHNITSLIYVGKIF